MSCKGCAVARRAPRDQCGAHPWGRGGAGATKGPIGARSAAAIGCRKLGCKRRGCAHLEEPWNPTRSLFQTPASRSLHKQAGCPGGAPLTTDSSRPLRIAALRACACIQGSADAPNPKPEGAHTIKSSWPSSCRCAAIHARDATTGRLCSSLSSKGPCIRMPCCSSDQAWPAHSGTK